MISSSIDVCVRDDKERESERERDRHRDRGRDMETELGLLLSGKLS